VKPLVIIPMYLTEDSDVETTMEAVRSVRKTVSDSVEILVVDDHSPERQLVDGIEKGLGRFDAELHRKDENSGFSKTVNVGLQRARDQGRDAVLLNADVEISTPGWLKIMQKTADANRRPAAVVGALLLYPTGLIQHAGIYFSLLTRTFDHMYKFGPGNLPEALIQQSRPVTGAFQFIRHDALMKVGLYDEGFQMAHEDVDYCIRTYLAGLECVYQPRVRAFHFEMMFRGRPSPKVQEWQQKSWVYFATKYSTQNFAGLVPFV
jgi:GT2 family glycosyltransferase